MKWSNLLSEVEHGLEESQNQRDARVEKLWADLDPGSSGSLDLKGLQRGFRKIDHRESPIASRGKRLISDIWFRQL